MGQGPRAHHGQSVAFGQLSEGADLSANLPEVLAEQVADEQHQRGVETSWLVSPRCKPRRGRLVQPASHDRHGRDDRVPTLLGLRRDGAQVSHRGERVDDVVG